MNAQSNHIDGTVLLRVEEAADLLRLSRAKVFQLVMDGSLPSVKIGKSRRVPADSLREWVRSLVTK
ncbi:MAG: helix-turn-helix domain-containing protein [Chloroflexota bacterium]